MMIRYALVKAGVVRAIGGTENMADAKGMDGEVAMQCSAAVQVGDLCDGTTFRAAPAAPPTLMALYGTADPLMVIDRAVDAKGEKIITRGVSKSITYRAKEEEVKAYRTANPLNLTTISTATMMAQYPTLMAMVAVWAPAATAVADQRTALAAMVTKVEAGIAQSAARLRKVDAIGTKAKEDIRAAPAAGKRTILDTALAAIEAV